MIFEIDNDNYRKIFLALAKDYRVIVIKLAMQEQLILSIVDNNSIFAKNVAQETLDVFAPIAHRLGISSIKTNLENRSLYILNNDDYVLIENMLKQTREERQKIYDEAEKEWGLVAQYDQAIEEMGELIVAINKYKRK